ncbi:MAG: hypothetical protein HZC25_04420 [Rhodospirillales bacterium]|nr:hypothetical protein [Rhodospirillales bacterium]
MTAAPHAPDPPITGKTEEATSNPSFGSKVWRFLVAVLRLFWEEGLLGLGKAAIRYCTEFPPYNPLAPQPPKAAEGAPKDARIGGAGLGFLAGGPMGAGVGAAIEAWRRRHEWKSADAPAPGSAEAIANKWGYDIMLGTTGLLFLYAIFLIGFGMASHVQRSVWLYYTVPLNDFLRSHVPLLDEVFARWLIDMRRDNMSHMIDIFYHFQAVVVVATAWITLTHSICQSFSAKRIHRQYMIIAKIKLLVLFGRMAGIMFFLLSIIISYLILEKMTMVFIK